MMHMGGSGIAFSFFGLFILLIEIALAIILGVLAIVFFISAIRFFKVKQQNDEQMIRKMDDLIQSLERNRKDGL